MGSGEATDVMAAIDQALEHIEKQALKLNTRKRDVKASREAGLEAGGSGGGAADCGRSRGGDRGSRGGA